MLIGDGRCPRTRLSGDNEEELRGYFDKLAVGGTIAMPLEKAEWGDTFGMVTDKFGTQWMVDIADKEAVAPQADL